MTKLSTTSVSLAVTPTVVATLFSHVSGACIPLVCLQQIDAKERCVLRLTLLHAGRQWFHSSATAASSIMRSMLTLTSITAVSQ